MKKCLHQTGYFQEIIEAIHTRKVENGKLDPDSFNNEYGYGICHIYKCEDCSKTWVWKLQPAAKWLRKLFTDAYSNID